MEADPAEAIFGTSEPDLFAVLGVDTTATTAAVTSAYRKLALRYHPDKIPPGASDAVKDESRRKFEQVGYAYKVLSDEKRRKRWEETGRTDEGFLDGGDEAGWTEYFKDLWSGVVNAQTIDDFAKKYQGSDEEKADLFAAFVECDGSLDRIFEHVMLSNPLSDEQRFVALIDAGIKDGKLPALASWQKEKKDSKARSRRQKAAKAEALEAEEMAKELGVHDDLFGNGTAPSKKGKGKKRKSGAADDDEHGGAEGEAALQALILKRKGGRFQDLISQLEEKALAEDAKEKAKAKAKGKGRKAAVEEEDEPAPKKAKGGKKKDAEPTEEEFQRIQAKMLSRK